MRTSRRYDMTCRVLFGALSICLAGTVGVRAQAPTRIVFVAGPKDHGAPGAHEHQKDLAALKGCLERSNVNDLKIDLVTGTVPDPATLTDAAAVVLESSGDRYEQEHHALFPFDGSTDHQGYDAATTARLAQFDALTKKGLGVIVFHYATYVNNATGRRSFQDWIGGYYESGYSRTVNTEWAAAPTTATHPILQGVQPWTSREEYYIRIRMPEADARRTPLIVVTPTSPTKLPALTAPMVPGGAPSPLTSPDVEPSLVSWAIDRPGGGRGFVMTGVHAYQNLSIDAHRRLLLNGIVWAARRDVPAGGVTCALPLDARP
ncbi:MAG: ThuA domain-containing protein [Acidobacteriota bacterium]